MKGSEVIYICGTDEHGTPNEIEAMRRGISPKELVDHYYKEIKDGFDGFHISFDNFSRTSREIHHETAKRFFLKVKEKGYIYKKKVKQMYCENCKRFLPDRYVEGACPYCGFESARGDQCDNCGRILEPSDLINPRCAICGEKPVLRDTEHYFFKLSAFQDELERWIKSNKHWKPNVVNFCLGWIKEGLKDRAITRDLEWGVKVPGEEDKVLYVWFEAPIGYISSTKEWAEKIEEPDKWKEFWMDPKSKIVHFIAKDNIPFHAIIWPAMLLAHGGYNLPWQIPANEYVIICGTKASASRKWGIWLNEYLKRFENPDFMRYTLLINSPQSRDFDFTWEEFQRRVNTELNDVLGNFVHRTLVFLKRYFNGVLPEGEIEGEVAEIVEKTFEEVGEDIENFKIKQGLKKVMELASFGNKYFDKGKPWEGVKRGEMEEVARVIRNCSYIVANLSVLLAPYLPRTASEIWRMLNLDGEVHEARWAPISIDGLRVTKEPKPLFRKITDEEVLREKKLLGLEEEKLVEEETIDIDYFKKIDLRVGVVKEAERIEGTNKLILLKVDLGSGSERTIVAGIGDQYDPEDLIGKKLIIVANLKPKKIRGVESQGMILAAESKGKVFLVTAEDSPPGAKVT